jgi:hypothetical protein
MENSLKLNFLPTYSYRFFKVSVIGLVCSTLLLLSIKLFNLEIISTEAVKWVIGFFLSIMAFSTEKFNNESLHFLKYYAGKFTLTLLIGFAFAMNATEFLMHRNMGVKYFDLIIIGLAIYSITYQILKLSAKKRKVEVLDTVFPDNIKYNPTLSWVVLILSLITLSLIFIVG